MVASLTSPSTPDCNQSAYRVRPQDEIWIINSRGLCGVAADDVAQQLRYEQYLPGKGWTASDFVTFSHQPSGMVTSFFIVGNYYTHPETIQTGWYAYHRLVARCAEGVSLRFVMWSWPSDPVPGGRLPDAKLKYTRVDPSAFQLAALIDRLDPATPISMCGSSFGVGIAAGSLQLLAGSRLGRYQLPPRSRPVRNIRAVLVGAAIHNDSLLPGRKYGMVMSQVDRVLLPVNPADRALRVYHWLYHRRSPVRALGRTGPVGLARLPHASRLDVVWVENYIGPEHGMLPYWQSPQVVAWMRPYLLMQPLPATTAGQDRH